MKKFDLNIEKILKEKNPELASRYAGYGTALKPAWEPICCGIK